jgi:hypothetical protein
MKYLQAKTKLRSLVVMLLTVGVIGLSALAAQAPVLKQNSVGSLKNIRTNNSMFFYADLRPNCARFVEMMPGLTARDAAASEHLKLVAAAL